MRAIPVSVHCHFTQGIQATKNMARQRGICHTCGQITKSRSEHSVVDPSKSSAMTITWRFKHGNIARTSVYSSNFTAKLCGVESAT